MSLIGIRKRSLVAQQIRDALISQGFEEYIPQLMDVAQPLEPTIYPFVTNWSRNNTSKNKTAQLYLATSPEGYLKQILAAGVPRCFTISHAFRNLEGVGKFHRPEFLMVEWYQQDANWLDMMRQTQEIVSHIFKQNHSKLNVIVKKPWPTISYRNLWQHQLHTDLTPLLNDENMRRFAKAKGYTIQHATWEQLFNQIVFNELEPHFSKDPFFLIDFPSRISPLAKPQLAAPEFAERFELIINRVELANGNTENTDAETIKAMMKQEQSFRQSFCPKPPLDDTFITSISKLKHHTWAGVGLGIDRLSMVIGGIKTIRDVQWI